MGFFLLEAPRSCRKEHTTTQRTKQLMGLSPTEHPELAHYREEFPILSRQTYLNSCSMGALSQRSVAHLEEYTDLWNRHGAAAWYELWTAKIDELRARYATLIGARTEEIGLAHSVSAGLSVLANCVDYSARPKIVLSELDFPTLAYQWLAKERLGVTVEILPSPDRVQVPLHAFERAVDERTALVCTSRVYFTSGYIQSVKALADLAHQHGAYLLVDDYQATGQVPLDVHATGADFLVSGSLKWLLGGVGIGFVYAREELLSTLEPTITGWFAHARQFEFDAQRLDFAPDARRLQLGTPALPSVYTALAGLSIIEEVGVDRIRERLMFLLADLTDRLATAGFTLRMADSPEQRSAIVMVEVDDPPAVVACLTAQQITVDWRPGAVRLSPHFYNTVADSERAVAALVEAAATVTA